MILEGKEGGGRERQEMEREREREREREKEMICCLPYTPSWGSNPQPRPVT